MHKKPCLIPILLCIFGHLLESILVTDGNSRKQETLIVVDLYVDVYWPGVVMRDPVDYLVTNSADTGHYCYYPHQPV